MQLCLSLQLTAEQRPVQDVNQSCGLIIMINNIITNTTTTSTAVIPRGPQMVPSNSQAQPLLC